MKATIPRLRKKLGSDPDYFRRVYLYTFEFARAEGQRSLGLELALAFWGLLLPHGLKGGALRVQDPGGDDLMKVDGGWTEEHTQLWYEFLSEKNIKGISKDTWAMARILSLSSAAPDSPDLFAMAKQFLAFLRSIDAKFETYDIYGTLLVRHGLRAFDSCNPAGAWPSTIDDFVEWARARVRDQGP